MTLLAMSFSLWGNPALPTVVAGAATFAESGGDLTITTAEMKTIIDWDSFSIARGELTHFDQINQDAVILNRVLSSQKSEIFGNLSSNGHLYLINPNGTLIGASGVIDVNGLVASTLDLPNATFLVGRMLFFSGNSEEAIENLGFVEGRDGGVVLMGRYLINRGDIIALTGNVELGASGSVWLDTGTDKIVIEPKTLSTPAGVGIDQIGDIRGAHVDLRADGALYTLAIRHTGAVYALASMELDGEVYLVADGGESELSGRASILSQADQGMGGHIEVLGKNVTLTNQAEVVTQNERGGGEIFIGGSMGGKESSVINAENSFIGADVIIDANGGLTGDGGTVSIFGTNLAYFQGEIRARGGSAAGNGGQVEISCNPVLWGTVDTRAPNGETGLLTLDPTNIIISGAATAGGSFDGSSPLNTFSGSAAAATLDSSDLNTALQTNNVLITTFQPSFGSAGNITILGATTLTLLTESHTLTLDADNDITVSSPFTMTDAASGTSTLSFIAGGDITLNSSVTGTNLTSMSFSAASGTIDLDNTLSGIGASVTLSALNVTSTGGATNALFANQCTITATDEITISNEIVLTGGGSGSMLTMTAGTHFNYSDMMTFNDWESASLLATTGDFIIDDDLSTTNTDALTLSAGQDLINLVGTSTFVDVTNQATALTLSATRDVLIFTQLDINDFLSCSVQAGRDFDLINDFEPDRTTTVSVSAVHDIIIIGTSADVMALNGETLSFTAGNDFIIEKPFNATNFDEVNITATRGTVDIGAGATFTLSSIDQLNIEATSGDLNIENTSVVNNGTGGIALTAGTDVNIGSAIATSNSLVGTRNGTVAVTAGRDLNVIGGAGTNDRAQIGFSAGGSVTSDIELTIARDINVTAGVSSTSVALIGHGFANINGTYSGDIIFHSVGGDVILAGNTGLLGATKYAQIGHARTAGSNTVTFSGDIRGSTVGSFATIDGTLRLTGGGNTESYALFGHGGQDSNAAESYSGEIRVRAQEIELFGGTSSDCEAAIGFFATAQAGGSNPVTITSPSTVAVVSDTTLSMTGSSNGIVSIGARVLNSAGHPVTIDCDLVSVKTTGDLTMTSGSGTETDATIGVFTDNGSGSGNLSLDIGGDLLINAGTGAFSQIVNGSGADTTARTMTVEVSGDLTPTVAGSVEAKVEALTGDLTVDVDGTLTLIDLTFIENLGGSDGTLSVIAGEGLQDGGFIRNSGSGAMEVITTTGGAFCLRLELP